MAKNTWIHHYIFNTQYFNYRHGHRPGHGADSQPEWREGGARLPRALPLHHPRPLRHPRHGGADQAGARAVSHQAGAQGGAEQSGPRSLRPQAAEHHRHLELRGPGGHEDAELLHHQTAGAQAAGQHHGQAGGWRPRAEVEAGGEHRGADPGHGGHQELHQASHRQPPHLITHGKDTTLRQSVYQQYNWPLLHQTENISSFPGKIKQYIHT